MSTSSTTSLRPYHLSYKTNNLQGLHLPAWFSMSTSGTSMRTPTPPAGPGAPNVRECTTCSAHLWVDRQGRDGVEARFVTVRLSRETVLLCHAACACSDRKQAATGCMLWCHAELSAAKHGTLLTDSAQSHRSRLNRLPPGCWPAEVASQVVCSSWRSMGWYCTGKRNEATGQSEVGGQGQRGAKCCLPTFQLPIGMVVTACLPATANSRRPRLPDPAVPPQALAHPPS